MLFLLTMNVNVTHSPHRFAARWIAVAGGVILASALMTGCAGQDSRASEQARMPDDVPAPTRCSLEQVQLRKELSRDASIGGVATPFLIHLAVPVASDRRVRSGEAIFFSPRDESAVHPAKLLWQFETLDPAGHPRPDATPLSDGNMMRLRHEAAPAKQGDFASEADPPLVIVKADVPDQTRPSTCDDQIRDGDFVFIHTISPSLWLGATPGNGMHIDAVAGTSTGASLDSRTDPQCAQDHESCSTDDRGGLVCAWAPACAK